MVITILLLLLLIFIIIIITTIATVVVLGTLKHGYISRAAKGAKTGSLNGNASGAIYFSNRETTGVNERRAY